MFKAEHIRHFSLLIKVLFLFREAEITHQAHKHKSTTLTPFDLNGTEPTLESLLTPFFTLLFLAKMAS